MQLNTMVHDLNHVKIGYTSAVALKFDKLIPSLNGSSKFKASSMSYDYEEKTKIKSNSKNKKSRAQSEKRKFTLNKSKVRDKLLSLFHLKQSRSFSAFLTISFPCGFSDQSGIKVLNNVLTNVRSSSLKFNYLWVAERQKNGTIHFHMVVNRFFNVRLLNAKFANAIQKELINTQGHDIQFDKKTYNGLDIKFIRNKKAVAAYITKYISKNNVIMDVRAWACDQITSRLFTHISELAGNLQIHPKVISCNEFGMPVIYENEWCKIMFFKHILNNKYIKILQQINQDICDGVGSVVQRLRDVPIVHKDIKPNLLFSAVDMSRMLNIYH